MSFSDIRHGIKAAIDAQAIPLLEVFPYRAGAFGAAAVHIDIESLPYYLAMGDPPMFGELWRLWVLLSGDDFTWQQQRLDDFLDPEGDESIVYALRQAPDLPLNGESTVGDSWVQGFAHTPNALQGPSMIDWMGATYWGCALSLRVLSL